MASYFASAVDALLNSTALSVCLCVLVVSSLYCWYSIAYAPYSFFKKRGIKGPTPSAFFGNALQFGENTMEFYAKIIKQYGKVCGYYMGRLPVYVIVDTEMVKQITVKKFDHFVDRFPPTISETILGTMTIEGSLDLFIMPGEQWRPVRRFVTPTFSSRNLKMMSPLVEKSCIALVEQMEHAAQSGKSMEMKTIYGQYVLETIFSTVFGHQVEILRGKAKDDVLHNAAKSFIENLSITGVRGLFGSMAIQSWTPWFMYPLLRALGRIFRLPGIDILTEHSKAVVQARRQMKTSSRVDFIQMMVDADNEPATPASTGGASSTSSSKNCFTDNDIVAMVNLFLLAGYDATSASISFTSYLLAIYPEKQDKLCAHIDAYYEEHDEANLYDAAHSIPYLEWVLQESHRVYSVQAISNRYCSKTCTIGEHTIPEGCFIDIPFAILAQLPEYWEEAREFTPERFHPDEKAKHHPLAHMPFGWGPRNCVGMRYGMMLAKMALVSILRKLKFERAPDTEIPVKTKMGVNIVAINGIHLKIVARE